MINHAINGLLAKVADFYLVFSYKSDFMHPIKLCCNCLNNSLGLLGLGYTSVE